MRHSKYTCTGWGAALVMVSRAVACAPSTAPFRTHLGLQLGEHEVADEDEALDGHGQIQRVRDALVERAPVVGLQRHGAHHGVDPEDVLRLVEAQLEPACCFVFVYGLCICLGVLINLGQSITVVSV